VRYRDQERKRVYELRHASSALDNEYMNQFDVLRVWEAERFEQIK